MRLAAVRFNFGFALLALAAAPVFAAPSRTPADDARLKIVRDYADHVLADAADRLHTPATPLLANGINVYTKDQLEWVLPDGRKVLITDLAVQQNLFRTLAGLSALTGEARYKDAAKAQIAYYFAHFQDSGGLLHWGGHNFVDLRTLAPVGFEDKGGVHEMKNVFPFYELMYEVNPEATKKLITAFWNAHVYNWRTLETSRHGAYGHEPGPHWSEKFEDPAPYFETKGLSFLSAGNDLIYSGAMLYRLAGDADALRWTKLLVRQYVKARNPQTQLGAYQFTQPKKTGDAPGDNITLSWFGDRAKRQFGPDFPDHLVLEATMLLSRMALTIYSHNALMQLHVAEALGDDGRDFREWTRSGMKAFVRHAYDEKTNLLKPMLTDGTDLTGFTLKRNGYYGSAGTTIRAYPATSEYLLSYARAFLVTGEPEFWKVARGVARAEDLGDIGAEPGRAVKLNLETKNTDTHALFAMLDLHRRTKNDAYLALARKLGDNIVAARWHHGYFTRYDDQIWANIDAVEPHALLALEAAIRGQPELVADFLNSSGYIDGQYRFSDGVPRTTTDAVLYRPRKSTSPDPVPPVRDPNAERIE